MNRKKCKCKDFKEAVSEGAFDVHEFARGTERLTVYSIKHPSGDEEEGYAMRFCPFCGRSMEASEYMNQLIRQSLN